MRGESKCFASQNSQSLSLYMSTYFTGSYKTLRLDLADFFFLLDFGTIFFVAAERGEAEDSSRGGEAARPAELF